jgi:hypothetical protein
VRVDLITIVVKIRPGDGRPPGAETGRLLGAPAAPEVSLDNAW